MSDFAAELETIASGLRRRRHADAFGRFEMAEWRPHLASPLHGVVERIWYWDGRAADRRECVFPDVTLELIVQLDEPYRPVVGERAGDAFPLVCIEGLRCGPATIEAPERRCRVLGLRFTPPGAFAVLRVPLGEIVDRTVDLRDVAGRAGRELAQRCGEARDAPSCMTAAARWVAARVGDDRPDPVAAWCTAAIVTSGGRLRAGALAEAAGCSSSRLGRRFVTHVGVTPKRFARLVRFRRALDALASGAALGDVVFDGGYYDHAHFDAEFREHAGLSPTAFLRASKFPQSASLSIPGA